VRDAAGEVGACRLVPGLSKHAREVGVGNANLLSEGDAFAPRRLRVAFERLGRRLAARRADRGMFGASLNGQELVSAATGLGHEPEMARDERLFATRKFVIDLVNKPP